jgi:hypothetical protein
MLLEPAQVAVERELFGIRIARVDRFGQLLLADVEPGAEHEAEVVQRPRPEVELLGADAVAIE